MIILFKEISYSLNNKKRNEKNTVSIEIHSERNESISSMQSYNIEIKTNMNKILEINVKNILNLYVNIKDLGFISNFTDIKNILKINNSDSDIIK